MEGHFTYYPEIKWTAVLPIQNNRISERPSVDFKLESFRDLRELPNDEENKFGKLKLVGSNGIIMFVNAPDLLLNEIIKRLPMYEGKGWEEISLMKLK